MAMLSVKCVSIVTVVTLIIGLVLIGFGAYTAYYHQPDQTTLEIEIAGYDAQGNRLFSLLSSEGAWNPENMQTVSEIRVDSQSVDQLRATMRIVWVISPSTWKPSVTISYNIEEHGIWMKPTGTFGVPTPTGKWVTPYDGATAATASHSSKNDVKVVSITKNEFASKWGEMEADSESFIWEIRVKSIEWSCTDPYGNPHSGILTGTAGVVGEVVGAAYEIGASIEITSTTMQIASGMFNEAADSTYTMANQVSTPIPMLSIVLIVAGVETIAGGLLSAKKACMVMHG